MPSLPDFFEPLPPDRTPVAALRDFCPGAYTYHWHNGGDAPKIPQSYFGRSSGKWTISGDAASASIPARTAPPVE